MARSNVFPSSQMFPAVGSVLELVKPVTWFAPMWAFLCGAVSSRDAMSFPGGILAHGWMVLAGLVLAGPLVCGTSQAVNDWFDRHVDAINEPGRPIPSGRIPGRWGFVIAIAGTVLSLLYSWMLGPTVALAALAGLALAWAYSAPPARLKKSGWWGPAAVALSYEGLSWFTGAAVVAGGCPDGRSILLAVLYSVGAHGIMTLNDFKAIEGDRLMGLRSLPVLLGPDRAARFACCVMTVPQILVAGVLVLSDRPWFALFIGGLIIVQCGLMARLMKDPRRFAPWYNATGTTLYVLGMLVSAVAVRSLPGGMS